MRKKVYGARKKKHVYVVTSGSCSDYGLDAIFSSEEKAKEYITALPDRDCNGITEMVLDPNDATQIRKGMEVYKVVMLKDGTTTSVIKIDRHRAWWANQEYLAASSGGLSLVNICYAKDAKHAVKITNEHRARMIASGEWS